MIARAKGSVIRVGPPEDFPVFQPICFHSQDGATGDTGITAIRQTSTADNEKLCFILFQDRNVHFVLTEF
jgi:hypothetical protein